MINILTNVLTAIITLVNIRYHFKTHRKHKMKCQLTGMPENEIDPPDDELAPDTPQEKVSKYLNGENVAGVNIYDYKDADLAPCFRNVINIYRDYRFDRKLTACENKHEFLSYLSEYLNDAMLELTDET